MIDNTELIIEYFKSKSLLPLNGKGGGVYVFCELLSRSKDTGGPDFKVGSYVFYSIEDMVKKVGVIKKICAVTKARAYIYLTSIKTKKVHLEMAKLMLSAQENEYYDRMFSVFDSACGRLSSKSKLWMVDIDVNDTETIDVIKNKLYDYGSEIEFESPSVKGVHLGIKKFNTDLFYEDSVVKKHIDKFEIKKSTPMVILCF
jgi:hypothetical protein